MLRNTRSPNFLESYSRRPRRSRQLPNNCPEVVEKLSRSRDSVQSRQNRSSYANVGQSCAEVGPKLDNVDPTWPNLMQCCPSWAEFYQYLVELWDVLVTLQARGPSWVNVIQGLDKFGPHVGPLRPESAKFGRRWAESQLPRQLFGQLWGNLRATATVAGIAGGNIREGLANNLSTEFWPDLVRIRQRSPQFGRIRAKFYGIRPNLTDSVENPRNWSKPSPNGRHRAKFGDKVHDQFIQDIALRQSRKRRRHVVIDAYRFQLSLSANLHSWEHSKSNKWETYEEQCWPRTWTHEQNASWTRQTNTLAEGMET